jgi:hypothetical protein
MGSKMDSKEIQKTVLESFTRIEEGQAEPKGDMPNSKRGMLNSKKARPNSGEILSLFMKISVRKLK